MALGSTGVTRGWWRKAALALAVTPLLQACGTGEAGMFGTATALATSAASGIITSRSGSTGAVLTDQQLLAWPEPLLKVHLPKRGATALLTRQVINEGRAFTWVTQDGITVTLRNGQIFGTRGLGGDLMSVDAPDVRGVRGAQVRDHFQLGGNELVQRRRYLCTVANGGAQTVVVAGRAHRTSLITETCESQGLGIVNSYWVEADGLVRKARQYLTPELGYVEFENIHG